MASLNDDNVADGNLDKRNGLLIAVGYTRFIDKNEKTVTAIFQKEGVFLKSDKNKAKNVRSVIFYPICFLLFSCCLISAIYFYSSFILPDTIYLVSGEEQKFNFKLPVSAEIQKTPSTNSLEEVTFNTCTKENPQNEEKTNDKTLTTFSTVSQKSIHLNLSRPFSVVTSSTGSYSMSCKFLGLIKVKDVTVSAVSRPKLIACGIPVGIYLETNGVLIIGTSEISDRDGNKSEPALNIVKSGDYIQKINNKSISSKADLINEIHECNGEDISLGILRGKDYLTVSISPVETEQDIYKLGIWVRDNAQGIGTLTYLSLNNEFGALGHGITDIDTGNILSLKKGILYETKILSIERGASGYPGELMGVINYKDRFQLGNISQNSYAGIFGIVNQAQNFQNYLSKYSWDEKLSPENAVDVGFSQEIKKGDAFIQCEVDGTIRQYSIMITNISKNNASYKGIEFHVTDPELLSITGGIVQGMSGSPILQDGKIIGAVTHVFVDDPTKGYGIFIETMLVH